MNLLKATLISHSFDYELFKDISLHVNEGDRIAITGVSGSGKSTFLHILSTLLKPQSGDVEILGKKLDALSTKDLVHLRSNDLGIIFQAHYLFRGFSAMENLEVASMLSQESIDAELLQRLGISEVMYQKVSELSGGQQQRVSIARVLTKKPRIIFADEPTGNLDNKTANEVMNIFDEYIVNNKAALVLVTHDENLASRCDKIFHLENKELLQVK
ncbi:ABC transporter ATP-binding protein [bacterium]|nr:ABC transporter ATP-binding protein [bacterium]MBU1884023.1 ABC transporter ATP-binding protein [bacterium]